MPVSPPSLLFWGLLLHTTLGVGVQALGPAGNKICGKYAVNGPFARRSLPRGGRRGRRSAQLLSLRRRAATEQSDEPAEGDIVPPPSPKIVEAQNNSSPTDASSIGEERNPRTIGLTPRGFNLYEVVSFICSNQPAYILVAKKKLYAIREWLYLMRRWTDIRGLGSVQVSTALAKGTISDGDITLVLERPGEKSQAKNFQIDEGTVMSVEEEDDMSVVPYAEQSDDKGREGFNWILLAGVPVQ
eukprot:jgi/Bigna1/77850/fgenesh1_pg.50_\